MIGQRWHENPLFAYRSQMAAATQAKLTAVSSAFDPSSRASPSIGFTDLFSDGLSLISTPASDPHSVRFTVIATDCASAAIESPSPLRMLSKGVGDFALDRGFTVEIPSFEYEELDEIQGSIKKIVRPEFYPGWNLEELEFSIRSGKIKMLPSHIGTYVLTDHASTQKAIIKFQNLEPGTDCSMADKSILRAKLGLLPKEGAPSEVLVHRFSQIASFDQIHLPFTLFAELETNIKSATTCSIQQFIPDCQPLGELDFTQKEALDVSSIQQLAILDMIMVNTDRNYGNVLISKEGKIYPIDHSLCLPRRFESNGVFCWLDLSQAQLPFSEENKRLIFSLAPGMLEAALGGFKEIAELDLHTFKERFFTYFMALEILKNGAALDLTPFEIGYFFTLSEKEASFDPSSVARKLFLKIEEKNPLAPIEEITAIFSTEIRAVFTEYQRIKSEVATKPAGKEIDLKEQIKIAFDLLNQAEILN